MAATAVSVIDFVDSPEGWVRVQPVKPHLANTPEGIWVRQLEAVIKLTQSAPREPVAQEMVREMLRNVIRSFPTVEAKPPIAPPIMMAPPLFMKPLAKPFKRMRMIQKVGERKRKGKNEVLARKEKKDVAARKEMKNVSSASEFSLNNLVQQSMQQ